MLPGTMLHPRGKGQSEGFDFIGFRLDILDRSDLPVQCLFHKTSMPPSLVIPISLFFPWISVVMISSRFPEAGFVLFHQRDAAHPLGALQKYRCGTTMRAGPPCSGASG